MRPIKEDNSDDLDNTAPAAHNTAPAAHNTAPAAHNTAPAAHNTAPAAHNTAPAAHNTAPAAHTGFTDALVIHLSHFVPENETFFQIEFHSFSCSQNR